MGKPIMKHKQCSKEKYEAKRMINWQTAYKDHLTYRQLLQYIGTDLFRKQVHEDTWVNAMFSRYKLQVGKFDNIPIENSYPNWIITDVRFPNEVKAIEDRGGFVIRVERSLDHLPFESIEMIRAVQHESETALDDHIFNYTLANDSTLKSLGDNLYHILKIQGILK